MSAASNVIPIYRRRGRLIALPKNTTMAQIQVLLRRLGFRSLRVAR